MSADRSPAERVVGRDIGDQSGRSFSSRMLAYERSLEAYLRAGLRPRWMERLIEIENATKRARRELERAWSDLREACGDDDALFARRWRETAERWHFDDVNELIRQHNDWYPIERDLRLDPRTGEYLPIAGRSYRREELGPDWVLARFPAD